jgi:hypothetical protein
VLGGLFDRFRKAPQVGAGREPCPDRTALGIGRRPGSAPVRLPRHHAALLRTAAWRPLTQLTDQRIRAHRGEHLPLGEMVETVACEVEDALAGQPLPLVLAAWRSWAAATGGAGVAQVRGLLRSRDPSSCDDVEAALIVQADLAALVPQLVVSRLSENVR